MRIRLLGGLEVTSPEGRPVHFATRKSSLLFAALVLAGRRGHRREQLSEAFWPGRGDAQSRNSLRQALADIRRSFPATSDPAISVEGDQEAVALVAGADEADIWVFERKLEDGRNADLAFAADLYRGDILAGEAIPGGLGEWFEPHQSRYQRKARQLVERLSLALSEPGSAEEVACEGLAERLLASDPAAEAAHRALIRIHAHRGHENAALRQFEFCRAALKKHLGAEPEGQTSSLAASLQERTGHQRTGPGPDVASLPKVFPVPTRRHDQPSVAVMPFDNLGGADDEYFVDGVVEEITSCLSRVRDFLVIARQSAFTYKGRFVDVSEVGRELGVNYVVEGTVRRGGDRLRISVQLVDTEARTQLWSERYEGAIDDVFEFQDRIAAQVAGAINPAIRSAEIELSKRKPPTSLRAYDLVMRAYPNLWGNYEDANQEAIALLREAVRIDPSYGRAHALLAWCHALNLTYGWNEKPESEQQSALRAVDAARGSINDDPTALAAAGAALSLCGELDPATVWVERALLLDPNNAWAWARSGWLAIFKGEPDRAAERFQQAIRLSPLDPFAFNMTMGMAASLAVAGSLAEAVAIAKEAIHNRPDVTWSLRMLTAWSVLSGDLKTAQWAAEKLLAAQPNFTIEKYRALPVFRNIPQWADQLADGLRLAGLPER